MQQENCNQHQHKRYGVGGRNMNTRPSDRLSDVLMRAVEQSPSIVLITNLDGIIEYVNPVLCRLTGYSSKELVGQHIRVLKSGEMPEEEYAELWRCLKSGADWRGEFCNRKKNGELFWEAAAISPIRNSSNVTEYYLNVGEDVTHQKNIEAELLASRERYERVVTATRGFLFTVLLKQGLPEQTIYYPGSTQVTGYSAAEYQAEPLLWFRMIVEEDRPVVTAQIDDILTKHTQCAVEHRIRHKNGSIRWVRNVSVPTLNSAGLMIAYDGLISDITELKEAQLRSNQLMEEVQRMAAHDPLTDLFSRRGFKQELIRAWQLGERHDMQTGLLIMDIDHLKVLNDTYGHAVGDDILAEAARLISDTIRASDIASRYGGDEMVVILPLTGLEEVRRVAHRLLEAFRGHIFCKGTHDLQVTLSIGGACGSGGIQSSQITLLRADRALYRAKRLGRNTICVHKTDTASSSADTTDPVLESFDGEQERKNQPPSKGRIMVVDSDPAIRGAAADILRSEGYIALTMASAEEARHVAEVEAGSVDLAFIDMKLGNSDGLDVLQQLRQTDDTLVGVIITGHETNATAAKVIRSGASDLISKPFTTGQFINTLERAMRYRRLLQENRRYQNHLEAMVAERSASLSKALERSRQSYRETLESLAAILAARENKTGEHCKRVAIMSQILARELGLSDKAVEELGHGALLHDIGKIAIPDAILLKKDSLTEDEWRIMRRHPQLGYDIVNRSPALAAVAEFVYSHQEQFDGTGYPRGQKGAEICLGVRIFSVVDTYDAVLSERPYSAGQSFAAASAEIVRGKGTQFDPAVVEAFLRCKPAIEKAYSEAVQNAANTNGAGSNGRG